MKCSHVNCLITYTVVEILISHLFSDPMSLVTHEAPPWLVLRGERF